MSNPLSSPTPPLTDAGRAAEVLVIGEALIDVVPTGDGIAELPGGSPANVALALGRLGRRARLATSLGADLRGTRIISWLEASGVEASVCPAVNGRTSSASVRLGEDGSAVYDFDLEWHPDPRWLSGVVDEALRTGAGVVHTGSIATVLAPGADAVLGALRRAQGRALLTFDPNARPAITPDAHAARAQVERIVALSDVVKVSQEDLQWYFPGVDALEVARRWARPDDRSGRRVDRPAMVVVTLGVDGSVVVRGSDILHVPGRPAVVADTIGAGDTYMGALLDALITSGAAGPHAHEALGEMPLERLEAAASWATAAAAITVSRPGADPPTHAELVQDRASAPQAGHPAEPS